MQAVNQSGSGEWVERTWLIALAQSNLFSSTLLGGVLLGLSSSLHCMGMCGPIASSLLFIQAPAGSARRRAEVLLVAQVGRIFGYCVAGAILGEFGSEFYGLFDRESAYRLLQWSAAASLGWIGLSVAGLLPPLSFLDRLLAPISRAMLSLHITPNAWPTLATLISGLAWGFLPCGMVFAALFTAMLTGSGSGGFLLMAGFGLGTLPSVTIKALGLTAMPRLLTARRARVLIGLCIASTGTLGLLPSGPGGPLCLSR